MGRKCLDYIKELNDYLDGDLDPSVCAEIEKHIGECNNCRIMVDSLRQTVKLCREGKEEKLPEELESRLNGMLKARWQKKFGRA
ncbi:MAG TPA: zf-HC2 domain-containing protein [candidate division Zixibacteria bacterium]|nr:zf-HC2 domain-containing protein [candidate division Zixibacteria bacterium]